MAELMAKVFKGMNVFMSRNLVPPELFDSLHDALKLNGAQVFLCCDPSRNASNDYHVISSPDHEKFEDLRSKGCNLLGPHCVLSCAKEHRPLPKKGFTCCLAMDGVKLVASGFETEEKAEIGKLVTSMGGVLQIKTSMDVNFVIAKNVLAAKYKWALNKLKKPIVTINWLRQCWKEHRVVPQESFRLLPFSGLTICVSRIPADQRKEMEKIVSQNGGKYSAELTKNCTHLVCDAPEGDKYKVAKRWGHIHIVCRKWFDQSVTRRACLNEESYPVQGSSASLNTVSKRTMLSQDKSLETSQCVLSNDGRDPESESAWYAQTTFPDQDAEVSHNTFSMFHNASTACTKDYGGPLVLQSKTDPALDGCIANDSQSEDNDLYLSDCKVLLAGFDASDMRKFVNMVRRGGGSRYMCLSEKLTHVVVGTPSDIETKEIRSLAACGIIYVVKTEWLEDCNHEKKEVPVLRRHIAYDLLLPKDPICSKKRLVMDAKGMSEGRSCLQPTSPDDHILRNNSGCGIASEKRNETEVTLNSEISLVKRGSLAEQNQSSAVDIKGDLETRKISSHEIGKKSLSIFEGKLFCFSCSFPENERAVIVEWVNQGGGKFVENEVEDNVQFIVESHGVVPPETEFSSKYVSSHWIRSCLMDGCLLDVTSHIIYSPLPCQVPFSVFQSFRFCVSQYDEKERFLLRNLCSILGVKFVEKLTKRVTHLLCKFSSGPKYGAACKYGIQAVTSHWVYECVKQNKLVAPGPFCPKEVTAQDQEAGVYTTTQYPTQACQMMSEIVASQLLSQSKDLNDPFTRKIAPKLDPKHSNDCNKRARTLDTDNLQNLPSQLSPISSACRINPTEQNGTENARESSSALPDVATAIEDLLEQTSKIHDQKSPDRSRCEKSLFTSDSIILDQDHREPQSSLALPKQWMNRSDREDISKPSGDAKTGIYDNFSETQTESQVVGYAEDLSGMQMIIDRVRTRSSMT